MIKSINLILKYFTTLSVGFKLVVSVSPSEKVTYGTDTSIGDIADYIASKGYVPNEKELPRASLIKNNENDSTYLLTKLSDEELIRLLNEQPQKNEYDLNDIMRIAFDAKTGREKRLLNKTPNMLEDSSNDRKKIHSVTNNEPPAYFRLNHRPVYPSKGQNDANYIALQKLQKLLNLYPQSKINDNYDENDDRKQLIFDILVAQLKTLCCKSSKKTDSNKGQHNSYLNNILPSLLNNKINIPNRLSTPIDLSNKYNEFMFLIINDEIKSNGSDDLIEVDPESLDGNSSVLLLGPVTAPLSDDQLKLVMSRISNELVKPEYVTLLQQLSDGMINDSNKIFMKNVVFGPNTRRYIKPHRCNHQSKLAKVYGGPKWIVCTGYLNLNKPSLYD